MSDSPTEKRVKFDFEIEFSNGGGIQGQDFRVRGMRTFPVRAFATVPQT